jgi:hypothetical protein
MISKASKSRYAFLITQMPTDLHSEIESGIDDSLEFQETAIPIMNAWLIPNAVEAMACSFIHCLPSRSEQGWSLFCSLGLCRICSHESCNSSSLARPTEIVFLLHRLS